MPVVSIANQKGGVSKTTTTQALVTLFNQKGKKSLAVDLDPQGNLSFAMGAEIEGAPTIYNALKGEVGVAEILQSTPSGDILPANILLSGADTEFTSTGREYMLKETISEIVKDYDHVFIDCPPALSILTINAFVASSSIVIPAAADVFSLQGMAQLAGTIQRVKKYCNSSLAVAGVLLTRFNPRTKLSSHIQQMLEGITANMDTVLFSTVIRSSITVQETQYRRRNLLEYDGGSNANLDYRNFVRELEAILDA